MYVDIFNHFMPRPLFDRLCALIPEHAVVPTFPQLPTLLDVEARLRLVDAFEGYRQVLSLANPPLELLDSPERTPELARCANDALATMCREHPDQFPGFVAALPMNNIEASLAETDRAIGELGACGIQVFTNVAGKPLSDPAFRPIFERMVHHDLPVWIHPIRAATFPDYSTESKSEHEIWFSFGWPYETTACATRLIFSGIFDDLPALKIILHHMGGMIPHFAGKIKLGFHQIFFGAEGRNPVAERAGLKRPVIEYYKMLYADTSLNGDPSATRCGHDFFTSSHALFGTDAPFDYERGHALIGDTIAAVKALPVSEWELEAIFHGNARALLKLPL